MKKFEYHVHETGFIKFHEFMFTRYLNDYGETSWELINIIPLQTVTGNLALPGQAQIKLTFLCVFKRQKKWKIFRSLVRLLKAGLRLKKSSTTIPRMNLE